MRPKLRRHRRLQLARIAADARLHALPNVVGTGFGLKEKAGVRSTELCFTVFVRRKVPSKRLKRQHQVPDTVRRHGLDLPTDVIEIGRIRKQGGYKIDVGYEFGTTGAWATNGTAMYGVTCAHCLSGVGSMVTGEFPSIGNPIGFGPTIAAIEGPGTGVYPGYGAFDAGVFQLTTPNIAAYAASRPVQPFYRPPDGVDANDLRAILNLLPVQGWGAASAGYLNAEVRGVFVDIPPQRFDLMFANPTGGGLTMAGDSGLLWTMGNGLAFAMHQAGEEFADGSSGPRAYGMFAFRIADEFHLQFRQA